MDFETDKLLAKLAGENVENFASCIISKNVKNQIDFAFNQMFQGLSFLQWMNQITLMDAWTNSLDEMIQFIFTLPVNNYITDYLRNTVFDFKKHTLKRLKSSIHAYEYCNCPPDKINGLNQASKEKIKCGKNIIMNLISNPNKCYVEKKQSNERADNYQKTKEREYERERK